MSLRPHGAIDLPKVEVRLTIRLGKEEGLLGWSQTDLSAASKTATKTIADFERGAREPYSRTIEDVRGALENAGIVFIEENGGGPGVRLRKAKDSARPK